MKKLEQRKKHQDKTPSAITENIPKEIFRSDTFKDITKRYEVMEDEKRKMSHKRKFRKRRDVSGPHRLRQVLHQSRGSNAKGWSSYLI